MSGVGTTSDAPLPSADAPALARVGGASQPKPAGPGPASSTSGITALSPTPLVKAASLAPPLNHLQLARSTSLRSCPQGHTTLILESDKKETIFCQACLELKVLTILSRQQTESILVSPAQRIASLRKPVVPCGAQDDTAIEQLHPSSPFSPASSKVDGRQPRQAPAGIGGEGAGGNPRPPSFCLARLSCVLCKDLKSEQGKPFVRFVDFHENYFRDKSSLMCCKTPVPWVLVWPSFPPPMCCYEEPFFGGSKNRKNAWASRKHVLLRVQLGMAMGGAKSKRRRSFVFSPKTKKDERREPWCMDLPVRFGAGISRNGSCQMSGIRIWPPYIGVDRLAQSLMPPEPLMVGVFDPEFVMRAEIGDRVAFSFVCIPLDVDSDVILARQPGCADEDFVEREPTPCQPDKPVLVTLSLEVSRELAVEELEASFAHLKEMNTKQSSAMKAILEEKSAMLEGLEKSAVQTKPPAELFQADITSSLTLLS